MEGLKTFPRGYRNCIRYLYEQYQYYRFIYRLRADFAPENYDIFNVRVNVKQSELLIEVNLSMIIERSVDMYEISKNLHDLKTLGMNTDILTTLWFETYNATLFPDVLLMDQSYGNQAYLYFSELDYIYNCLASIELQIRRKLSSYNISVHLSYVDDYPECVYMSLSSYIGRAVLRRSERVEKKVNVRLVINVPMALSIDHQNTLRSEVLDKLTAIAHDMRVCFFQIILELDFGEKLLTIPVSLNNEFIDGGKKVLYISQLFDRRTSY